MVRTNKIVSDLFPQFARTTPHTRDRYGYTSVAPSPHTHAYILHTHSHTLSHTHGKKSENTSTCLYKK